MIACDLFCGCGGTSLGLKMAGADVVLGADCDEAALAAYEHGSRYHCSKGVRLDLSDVESSVAALRSEVGDGLDILCGSPPCQDFSTAGSRSSGTRAALTVQFARIAVRLSPKVVVMENVRQMISSREFEEAKQVLMQGGYSVCWVSVNAAHCGVAQVRRRAFVVASRADVESILGKARALQKRPCPPTTVGESTGLRGCYYLAARNAHDRCVYSVDAPAMTLRCNCLARKPANYASRHDDAGCISEAHNLRPCDVARIASFPGDYFSPDSPAGRLVGNSVPPNVMATVVGWCKELLMLPPLSPPRFHPWSIPRPSVRVSRLARLVRAGLCAHGAEVKGDTLEYVSDGGEGDAIVERVLGIRRQTGWSFCVRERGSQSAATPGSVPVDDLKVRVPGVAQTLRTAKQVMRYADSLSKLPLQAS